MKNIKLSDSQYEILKTVLMNEMDNTHTGRAPWGSTYEIPKRLKDLDDLYKAISQTKEE